jgi:hypothetical protein
MVRRVLEVFPRRGIDLRVRSGMRRVGLITMGRGIMHHGWGGGVALNEK